MSSIQPAPASGKRVILSMGGKGGVGKTSIMTGLAEWFRENQIPVKLLDLDTENKARGSLTHFFGDDAPKVNIHSPAGLDSFVDELTDGPPVILADMGAGAGQVTYDWFDKMYPDVSEAGIVFTAIGIVTSDPASVESVLTWASRLQRRAGYLIVENSISEHTDFAYWRKSEQALQFQKVFSPAVIRMDYRAPRSRKRYPKPWRHARPRARRASDAPELQKASLVMRAQSYRRRMFAEFDNVKELLLP